jgi:hypothetical protein
MINETQQTAVTWFANKAYELFEQYSEGVFDRITLNKLMLAAAKEAEEMEKEQIKSAFNIGEFMAHDYFYGNDDCAENYYNETYGGNK